MKPSPPLELVADEEHQILGRRAHLSEEFPDERRAPLLVAAPGQRPLESHPFPVVDALTMLTAARRLAQYRYQPLNLGASRAVLGPRPNPGSSSWLILVDLALLLGVPPEDAAGCQGLSPAWAGSRPATWPVGFADRIYTAHRALDVLVDKDLTAAPRREVRLHVEGVHLRPPAFREGHLGWDWR